jgi:hypothetical protein
MKVDVEGAELLVFRGARNLLSSEHAPAIFFEADDRLGDTRAVKQLLVDCGYGIFRRRRAKYLPVALDETHQDEDLFALKPRHVAQMHRS